MQWGEIFVQFQCQRINKEKRSIEKRGGARGGGMANGEEGEHDLTQGSVNYSLFQLKNCVKKLLQSSEGGKKEALLVEGRKERLRERG